MPRISLPLGICIAGALLVLLGFLRPGSDDPLPVTNNGTPAVARILNFAFEPIRAVAPGETIEVANNDPAPHTFTAVDGAFDTGSLDADTSSEITAPAEAGTYEFFCAIHPSMTGSLTVQA